MTDWKKILRERLAAMALPALQAEDILEELASDLEERYQRALRAGLTSQQAQAEALAEIAAPEKLAVEIGKARGPLPLPPEPAGVESRTGGFITMFQDILQDIRYSVRMLARSPAFTLVAVLSLGLGIGANTTIFTLVNVLLLHPLPLENTDRLVAVFTSDARNTARFQSYMQSSYPNYLDYRQQNSVFSELAAQQFLPLSLTTQGEPEQIFGEMVTGNYFDVLGVKPAVGRLFSLSAEDDKQLGAHPEVVLSHALWKRRFGADAGIIGKKIELNRMNFTVSGVAQENFRGVAAVGGPVLWIHMSMWKQVARGFFLENFMDRRALFVFMYGRLKPGVSVGEADAAMKALSKQLERAYPRENDSRSAAVRPVLEATFFSPEIRRDMVSAGVGLMVVVGMVLLIACANVANLLLARAGARQREVAVRISLGASRGRLVRQMMTESLLLAILAGLAGTAIAYWSRDLLWSLRPAFLQADALNLAFDKRIAIFTAAISLLTGILFGLLPALQISKPNLAGSLKDRTAQPNADRRWFGLRNVLVAGQVALSLVALAGASLFLQSMKSAQQVDPGFETKHLMVLSFDTGAEGYAREKSYAFYRDAAVRVQALPGVESAAVAQSPPLSGNGARTVFPEGLDFADRRNGKLTDLNHVSAGYFETLGIPILRGRAFTENDREGAPMVAIINETMAKSMWPGQDALGKRFRCYGETWLVEVVGIARTTKYTTLGEEPTPYLYFPLLQHETPQATLHVRTKGDPAQATGMVRTAVQQLDPRMPLTNVVTIEGVISGVLWAPRMGAALLTTFGLIALLLAAMGIHGVVSYSVSQRTQEIGIRMALGASQKNVLSLILGRSLFVVGVGAAIGLAGAVAAARAMKNLLFVDGDALTFGGTALLLMLVACLASYLPARRAARIDPLLALRYE